jgi:hypothetical protein
MRWARRIKLAKELGMMAKESNLSLKECFTSICMQKRDILLFKLHSKMSKKINKYTGLPDVKNLHGDMENWIWYLEFYDKKGLSLISFENDEFNKFDVSLSITWYKGLGEMASVLRKSNKSLSDIVGVKIWLEIPVFIDFNTNSLTNTIGKLRPRQQHKSSILNINKSNRVLVLDQQCNGNIFKSNSKELKSVAKNDTIELLEWTVIYFLMGFWRSSNQNIPVKYYFNCIKKIQK